MAAFQKFLAFVQDIGRAVHNLNTATLKDALTNTAPVNTNAVLADITQVAATNFAVYSGGVAIGSTAYSQTAGTATLSGANVTFTASGGATGSFRYVVCYNSTAAGGPLIGYWDYASSISLADGETFTVDHSANILTLV